MSESRISIDTIFETVYCLCRRNSPKDQGTFAYDKFIETLCLTAIDPTNYMVISMTYRLPLFHKLLDAEQIREVKASPTFDQDSFDREYNSKWSGTIKGAAFDYKIMQKSRKVVRAELKASNIDPSQEFYIVCADMAKDGSANTAVVVCRVLIGDTHFTYKQVNGFKITDNDYLKVANQLKKTIEAYNVRLFIYDANGIGAALRDWINKDTVDATGEILPGLGIINPPTNAEKDVIKYSLDRTIVYEVKANTQASDINYLFFARMKSGAIKMLIPFREALERYKKIQAFCLASDAKKRRYMAPYQVADIIQEELLNLDVVEIIDTGRPALKVNRRNPQIQKDFFSAFSYLIWGVHNYIEMPYYKKRSKGKLSKLGTLIKIQNSSTNIKEVGTNERTRYSHF